ncbi:hypothetical protein HPB51_028575 [Rhipicephalus microplus]|uniref:Uncharacterized protein n=1 Tax=Rhipicephalus microplus TaxID=6941 RepID=A0A9J6CWN9_RHIMP|nr:hypothetical protein HPB51_028575 [Rhipicephalus microplus]
MADVIEESAREALRQNGPVTVLHGVRLADIEGIKGTFTNATLDYRSPCTASERGTCHIVRQLSMWNELLSDAYLELRKEPDAVGFLSLVTLERAYPSIPEARKLHQCATLVYWLLTIHRCVVSVDVHLRNLGPHYVLIFAALRGNPAVKTLKLGLWTYRSDHQEPLAIANCLQNIEKLECRLFPDWPPHILSALTMLLGRTTSSSLSSLKTPKIPLRNHKGWLLLEALVTNSTLKELGMRGADFAMVWMSHRYKFRRQLIGGACSLTTLSISDMAEMRKDVFKWLLGCLRENRTLTHVSLRRVAVDEDSAAVVTSILEENRVLRVFNMCEMRADTEGTGEGIFDSWLPALAANETLEEFTLPLNVWNPELWKQFADMLPSRSVTRRITIEFIQDDYRSLALTYGVLADTPDAGRMVCFKTLNLLSHSDTVWNEPAQCHVWLFQNTRDIFSGVLRQLPELGHVTIVQFRMSLDILDQPMSSMISSYIRATCTLKRLSVTCFSLEAGANNAVSFWSDVIESLAVNSSLTTLAMKPRCIKERAIGHLADVLKSSLNIHNVHIDLEESAHRDTFVRAMSAGVKENYVLMRVHLNNYCERRVRQEWFTIRDTVCRNSCLVQLAGEFVSGLRCDRYCAGALERMYRHVALPERVAQISSVSEVEASAMIREALKGMQGMHDFMRLAGVVKDRVKCGPATAPFLSQLDRLDDICWMRVRRYLRLDDVRDSGAQPPVVHSMQ